MHADAVQSLTWMSPQENVPTISRVYEMKYDLTMLVCVLVPCLPGVADERESSLGKLAPFFRPPVEFADRLGSYSSPLKFSDGREVASAADWQLRRHEILKT